MPPRPADTPAHPATATGAPPDPTGAPPSGADGVPAPTMRSLHRSLARWYEGSSRALPWRSAGTTPWGVLVSEVMLQQTPVTRVAPAWLAWMAAWPTPADLAAADPSDVLRAWDRLGYPRRALRLQSCARALVDRFDGEVPADEATLRTLPGVGEYTAAAVSAFAYGRRAVVLDTNVRRVLARLLGGLALPGPALTRVERSRAELAMPTTATASARWNIAVMELGALVCTARAPQCRQCPVAPACAWRAAGYPPDEHAARRRSQAWHGTDRQVRGRIMAALRGSVAPVPEASLAPDWPDPGQRDRALASLLADGLAVRLPDGVTLPRPAPASAPDA